MVELAQKGTVQNLVDQTGLTGTGHTCHTGQGSQRDLHINIFQIILRGSPNRQYISVTGTAGGGHGDFLFTTQILAGNGSGIGANLLQRSRCHDLTAVGTGTGTHVNHKVRFPHSILIMLHNDQSIAQIPEPL